MATVSRTKVHDSLGSYNYWTLKRIDSRNDGSIWCCYYDNNDYPKAAYSDDDGATWNEESINLAQNIRNPSMDVNPQSNDIWVAGTNSTFTAGPRAVERNGSWGSSENIDDAAPAASNNSICQILITTGNDTFAAYRHAPSGTYTQIGANKKSAGASWGSEVLLSLAANWKAESLSAVLDDNNYVHAVWQARNTVDSNSYQIQHAYWNGTAWSSITTIEAYTNSGGKPVINKLANGRLIILWSRDGVGTYTTKKQIRWSYSDDDGSNWETPASITDRDNSHWDYACCEGHNDGYVYLVFSAVGLYASEAAVENMGWTYYDGVSWDTGFTALTEESVTNNELTIRQDNFDSDIIHILWKDGNNDLWYHRLDSTVSTQYELYDYLDTIAADVDQTLTLNPQTVMTETGSKGDIIHVSDDESEERIGLSTEFTFYFVINYNLLNQSDAGIVMDLWLDSAKADGRRNSFKFDHPTDGHTYVVRFDTDMSQEWNTADNYSHKNIRLRVLGRIAD